ncbi:hypothetical protein [Pseudomonas sp. N040]|uniref:hypothetical protein n=1 Tax=Pseudomonas sp. N040 TaxID=2785325 RepID=UPI0018A26736|nr:hypothetical protein [Pseudomonas sp. N040]MBF7728756.1 hypothetical protein [Pseudomonas sp. N040]MBW7012396.1 hypothetical protein [Pseudomonas sp. N040]
MKNSEYFRTDTEHDAAFSLVAASDFLALADKKPHYWRWVVLAVHSAVQGSLALALTNGNILHVQKPSVLSRLLAALESKGQNLNFPNPHMDNFLRLYAKAKQVDFLRSGATPLPADERHERALMSLDEMRDEFAHFNSKSWSIEIAHIAETVAVACEVIEHVFRSGAALWHSDELEAEASRALESLKAALSGES